MTLLNIFILILLSVNLFACSTSSRNIVTDIRGKAVNPDTLMCKSIGEIGEFSGGNAILSVERTNRVGGEDILAVAKKMGATHIRWTNLGKKGEITSGSGEAYRCIFRTKEFRKGFAANKADL